MKVSTRARYALRLMIDLTNHDGQRAPVILRDVAERQQISKRYLEQLTMGLRSANLVSTARGHGGGYSLARPPEQIRVADIIAASIGQINVVQCVRDPDSCTRSDGCPSRRMWNRLNDRINEVFESVTLEECSVATKKQPEEVKAPLQGRKILVVDDEEDARTYISTVLEDAGAEVIEAADGDQALAMAAREKPDLITLDISMPGKDGVEVFGQLRRADETAAVPVCVVTGHPEFREVIYQRAVPPPDGYLDKPVPADKLVEDVRRILHLQQRKR